MTEGGGPKPDFVTLLGSRSAGALPPYFALYEGFRRCGLGAASVFWCS
jgi:hypothetical protein